MILIFQFIIKHYLFEGSLPNNIKRKKVDLREPHPILSHYIVLFLFYIVPRDFDILLN